MSKQEKKNLVPELRFPEFHNVGDWKIRPIGKVFSEKARPIDMLDEEDYSLVTVKRRYGGVVSRGIFKGKSIKVKSQFKLKENDFLISKRQIVHCACGLVPKGLENSIVSNEYSVLKPTEGYNINFLNYFSQQPAVSQSFLKCSIGIVIEKMLFKLNDWFKQEFLFPGENEQQKIADCLFSIDELITAHAQKLEALKAHKKGLMQQLFPAEGETVPKLRFPEFKDEWIKSTIDGIATVSSGGTPSRSQPEYWNGDIPWVTTTLIDFNTIYDANEYITEAGLDNSSAKMFKKNTILMAMYGQGKTRGQVAKLGIEAAINQACAAITLKKSVLTEFVFQNLASRYEEIRKISNDGGQKNLSSTLIKKIPFYYPDVKSEEQKKIADCLASIDSATESQTKKVESLKAHKEGLMQQLFPSTEGVTRAI